MGSLFSLASFGIVSDGASAEGEGSFGLPEPVRQGEVSIEEALERRRSVREYAPVQLSLATLGQLAWAAQGVTDSDRGFRTAPTAGATFPLEVDFLIQGVEELDDGVYRYLPGRHALRRRIVGDQRDAVAAAASNQQSLREAPAILALSTVTARTAARYGERAERYVHMEAGHVAQNVSLQAVALDLGTVVIGAFDDDALAAALQLDDGERPLYLMTLGEPG